MLASTDDTIGSLGSAWSKHVEEHCSALIQELKDQDIVLTDGEKQLLRDNLSSSPEIEEAQKSLAKLQIKAPNKAYHLAIAASNVVATALSFTPQKAAKTPGIVKELKAIGKEETTTKELVENCQNQFNSTVKAVTKLLTEAATIHTPSSPEQSLESAATAKHAKHQAPDSLLD